MADDRLLEAAIEYATFDGWAVFPTHHIEAGGVCSCRTACKSPGKHPRTPNGLQDATTDRDQIERWWGLWPDANIGVRTGRISNLLVLDVDNKNSVDIGGGVLISEGVDTLSKLQEENGPLPGTLTQETGSGGTHYLFGYPDEADVEYRNRASFLPSLDVRGEGGYIIVPPSNHKSGNRYRWLNENHVLRAPDWLLKLIREPATTHGHVLTEEPIREGSRNQELTRIAGHYRGVYCHDETDLFDLLMEQNQRRVFPPLEADEVRRIARSVARLSCNELTAILSLPSGAVSVSVIPPIAEGADTLPTIGEFMAEVIPTPVPLVEGLIDGGSGVIIGGRPNVGKSWLVFDLALSVASGSPYLAHFPTQQGSVLVLDEEGSRWGDQRRIHMLAAAKRLDLSDLPVRIGIGRGLKLDTELGRTTIRRMLERYRPDLVIYDSLIRAHSGNENDSAEMSAFFDNAKQLMQTYGTAFVFTHHVHKPSLLDSDNPADWLRGSSEINAWPDTALVIEPGSTSEELKVHHAKSRDHRRLDSFLVRLLVEPEDGRASVSWTGDVERQDRSSEGQIQAIKAVLATGDASLAEISVALARSPETVRQYLKVLKDSGQIEQRVPAVGKPMVYRLKGGDGVT